MKNIFYASLMIAMFLVLGGGCKQVKHTTPSGPPPVIKIGVQDNLAVALVLVAKEKGYFVKEGVDVQVVRYPSGKKALEGLFNKKVQMATVADVQVALESFSRNDFKICASIAESNESAWIIARKDKNINQIADLRGKKIGVQKLSGTHFFLSAFLRKNNIKEGEVETVFKESARLVDALKNGEVDAISGRNPFALQAKSALGSTNILEFFDPDAYKQNYILVSNQETIDKRPELVNCIMRALVLAEGFLKNNPEQSKIFLNDALNDDRSEEVGEDYARFRFELSLSQALLLSLENIDRWLINGRFVEGNKIPNILPFIYDVALEAAEPEAVTIIK